TVSVTCVSDMRIHEVRELDVAPAARQGRYPALCGQMITAASMAEPGRRRLRPPRPRRRGRGRPGARRRRGPRGQRRQCTDLGALIATLRSIRTFDALSNLITLGTSAIPHQSFERKTA
ncbi:MAG: hypothetical protein ACLGI6_19565, partial [Gammaproteobacteria bacterium]